MYVSQVAEPLVQERLCKETCGEGHVQCLSGGTVAASRRQARTVRHRVHLYYLTFRLL